MRRLFPLLVLVGLLAAYFAGAVLPASAAKADVCWEITVDIQNNSGSAQIHEWDFYADGIFFAHYTFTLQPHQILNEVFNAFYPAGATPSGLAEPNPNLEQLPTNYHYGIADDSVCNPPAKLAGFGWIGDGRINDGEREEGAPLAGYCTSDHGIAMWDIDATGHGTLGFTATEEQITKALSDAKESGQNVLIAEGLGNSLYALSTDELTLVGPYFNESGKTYQYITPSDRCE